MPAAGYRDYSDLYNAGSGGYYWSSMQRPSYTDYANTLLFYSSGAGTYGSIRIGGFSVRPVSR